MTMARLDPVRGFTVRMRDDMLPVAAVALVLTVLMSGIALTDLRHMGRQDSIARIVLVVLPEWLLWCALAPVVLQLFARSRGERRTSATRRITRYVVVGAGLMGVHSLALYAWQLGFTLTDLRLPLWQGALAVSRWRLSTNVLVYAALVAVASSRERRAEPVEPEPVPDPTTETPAANTLEPSAPATRLVVRRGTTVTLVAVETIDWIEAADYCARVHAAGRAHVVRESMRSLERRLDATQFFRAHRSAIVNLDRIREIQPAFRGEQVIVLSNGTKVPLARSRRQALERLLGQAV